MDSDRKLRSYRRKDYTERVEFPVEIVGRDGVVRAYDFQASVRLYQRRLAVAATRYREPTLVAAEKVHCRARIRQLRRSFFEQHGWETPEGAQGPEHRHPLLAGELAAFLVRTLRGVRTDPTSPRLPVRLTPVDGEPGGAGSIWYLTLDELPSGLLLSVYPFEEDDEDGRVRAAMHDELERLRRAGGQGDTEALWAYHHSGDCGFVLSGRAGDVAALAALTPDPDGEPSAPSPWQEVVDLVRRGDHPTAFLRCRWLLSEQPWHRDAYALSAMLALVLRRPGDAEDAAFVGSRYFPDDALLVYYLALAQVHQGRSADAAATLRGALALDPTLAPARSLALVVALARGRWLRALALTRGAVVGGQGDRAVFRRLVGMVRRMTVFVVATALALASTVTAVVWLGEPALVPLAVVMVLAALGASLYRERFEAAARRAREEDPHVARRRILHRRRREAQARASGAP